jgi:hypothetical protein
MKSVEVGSTYLSHKVLAMIAPLLAICKYHFSHQIVLAKRRLESHSLLHSSPCGCACYSVLTS